MTTVPMPDVRQAAVSIAVATIAGDNDAIRCELYAHADDGFAALIRATLNLLRELTRKLRSAEGLMAHDVKLSEISREHGSREMRAAAQLILGHAMTCPPPAETPAAAESFADFHDIGADSFNAACIDADLWFVDAFTTAMLLLQRLLPEVDTYMVGIVAAQLWASTEPEGIPMFRPKTPAEDSPPGPSLSIPVEAEVVRRPPRPTIPAGATVSPRGLAILRQRERGLDL
jgi:hypothetical protein